MRNPMNTKIRFAAVAAFFLSAVLFLTLSIRTSHPPVLAKNAATLRTAFAQLPLSFEANAGQTDSQVRYLARGAGYTIFLTANATVLSLQDRQHENAVIRLHLNGANAAAKIEPIDQLPGKSSYFIGNDPKEWRTDVPLFSKVRYENVYPGIDVVYHGSQRQLEYDFVVAPGADPNAIKLDFQGADKIDIDDAGDLLLHVRGGELYLRKPVVYQVINGARREVKGNYVLKQKSRVGFEVAKYDASKALVIDPVILYSTYLGGGGNEDGYGIAVDALGAAYVTGHTNSLNFPTMNAYQATLGDDSATSGNGDAFVTKYDANGVLVYSTYLGGSCTDIGFGIAVNAAGEAYITGTTGSGINPQSQMPDCSPLNNPFKEFPQVHAFQNYAGSSDAFVTKLNAAGNDLIYSSFLGGGGSEFGRAIAVDARGNAYVTGDTISKSPQTTNFPTTPGAFQTSNAGGEDAFVSKITYDPLTSTTSLAYSTYLGGGSLDSGRGITVDALGNAYVTGTTGSGAVDVCNNPDPFAQPAFPTTPNAYQTAMAPSPVNPNCVGPCCLTPNIFDAFVSKINPAGGGASDLVYSTYLGGETQAVQSTSAFDEGHAIALDKTGNVYV